MFLRRYCIWLEESEIAKILPAISRHEPHLSKSASEMFVTQLKNFFPLAKNLLCKMCALKLLCHQWCSILLCKSESKMYSRLNLILFTTVNRQFVDDNPSFIFYAHIIFSNTCSTSATTTTMFVAAQFLFSHSVSLFTRFNWGFFGGACLYWLFWMSWSPRHYWFLKIKLSAAAENQSV